MATKFDFIQQDKRIMEQQLRRHHLSKVDYQKHLKSLTDDSEFGETLYVCPEEEIPAEDVIPTEENP
ncbi:MAG: hypothetical protein IPJ69_14765 [Deltaproteobacteria bacterium]|nr:MAG: hypothetical protein IPJ69_14765 [Deltaproteobacteria bacterium]